MRGRENLGWGQQAGQEWERGDEGVGKGRDRVQDGTGRKGRDAGRGGTTEQDDAPLLKRVHVAEDVRQYEIKQRPQLCEVVLRVVDVSVRKKIIGRYTHM
jgi:hypothetical protein